MGTPKPLNSILPVRAVLTTLIALSVFTLPFVQFFFPELSGGESVSQIRIAGQLELALLLFIAGYLTHYGLSGKLRFNWWQITVLVAAIPLGIILYQATNLHLYKLWYDSENPLENPLLQIPQQLLGIGIAVYLLTSKGSPVQLKQQWLMLVCGTLVLASSISTIWTAAFPPPDLFAHMWDEPSLLNSALYGAFFLALFAVAGLDIRSWWKTLRKP